MGRNEGETLLKVGRLSTGLLSVAVVLTAAAQQSESYRLDEHAFNAGGRPVGGVVATSPSYRISLDAIGAPMARSVTLSARSYRMEPGLVPRYGPPGEVERLWFAADKQTLHWTSEPSVGDYSVYRDALLTLGGASVGWCLESGVTTTSTVAPAIPSPGEGYCYLVAARNRLLEEGSLGATGTGETRTPASPCP